MLTKSSLFHKIKSIVGYSIATVVILSALAIASMRFVLSNANLYQAEVEQLASSLLKQPVKIGKMDAKLSGITPTLIFHNVDVISKVKKISLLHIPRIDVGISFRDLLFEQKITPIQLIVRDLKLNIKRDVNGEISIKNVDMSFFKSTPDNENNPLVQRLLSQQTELLIDNSQIIWKDEQNSGLQWEFNQLNVLLQNTPERHQLILTSHLPAELGDKIKLSVDINGSVLEPKKWEVKAFVESERINFKPIRYYTKNKRVNIRDGEAEFELWFDWKNNKLKQLSGKIKLNNLLYKRRYSDIISIPSASSVFDAVLDEEGTWGVAVENFNYKNSNQSLKDIDFLVSFNHKNKTVNIKVEDIKLESVAAIVVDNNFVSEKYKKEIKNINIHGQVNTFKLDVVNNSLNAINIDFNQVAFNAWENIPKIVNLNGQISYSNNEGKISLSSDSLTAGFSGLFRKDLKISYFSSEILFSKLTKGLLFDIPHLHLENDDLEAESKLKLWVPLGKDSPHLDLQTHVIRGDASNISQYLPVGIMNDSLVKWIDEGILAGTTEEASIIFNGRINDFPFKKHNGIFDVDVTASNVEVNYQDGWPMLNKANIKGHFDSQGMNIKLLNAMANANVVYDSSIVVKDFFNPELKIKIIANGLLENTLGFLKNSPILSSAKETINGMRVLGRVDTELELKIPLNGLDQRITYSGSSTLNDSSLFMLKDKVDITHFSGKLLFSDKAFSSENMNAAILGVNSNLKVRSNNKSISVISKFSHEPGLILKRFDIPGANKINGKTELEIKMNFPVSFSQKTSTSKNSFPSLNVKSKLLGIGVDLPNGYKKSPEKALNFNLLTTFNAKNRTSYQIGIKKKASAIFVIESLEGGASLKKGAVAFSANTAVLPKKDVLYIDGTLGDITPSKWFKALGLNKKQKKPQSFFKNPIVVNLKKLRVLSDSNKSNSEPSNPQYLPSIEGIVQKLYFNKMDLGRLDFKSSHYKYGLKFDEIILSSQDMKLFANGRWQYKNKKHSSTLNVTLSCGNFGNMLKSLELSQFILNGETKILSEYNWQGAPSQFSMERLNGKAKININNGFIKDIDAGAGRLLGLLSLSSLPRKLFGDFDESFKDGFKFDTASGEIMIDSGDAYMDGFEIESPIASITADGRIGLADKDFETTIEVTPDVGGGVAGVTALLVNLPAGIGLWLIDKLTGEQFDKASIKTYEVSGSWEKPIIEEVTNDE
ncbi:MAG: DUF3971 domain-containing protein [Woeseiaceae bacterium]